MNLERRQPVALWPDREAATLAQGLRAHPGVEMMARDRAQADADGARHGAPAATQVADRVHLLPPLVDGLEHVVQAHYQALTAVNAAIRRQGGPRADGPVAVAVALLPAPLTAPSMATPRRARRVALHQQVWALHARGWPEHARATHLGSGKQTVVRDLPTTPLPARRRRRDGDPSVLNPDTPDRLERWHPGCDEALRLWGALQRRGSPGSAATGAR